jgi:hypothetical protein
MTVSNELIDRLLADYKNPEHLIGENGLPNETSGLYSIGTTPAIWSNLARPEQAANLLTNPTLDPFGKIPEFKYCAARISPMVG